MGGLGWKKVPIQLLSRWAGICIERVKKATARKWLRAGEGGVLQSFCRAVFFLLVREGVQPDTVLGAEKKKGRLAEGVWIGLDAFNSIHDWQTGGGLRILFQPSCLRPV